MLNKEQLNSLLNFSLVLVTALIVTFLLYTKFTQETNINELQSLDLQEIPTPEKFLTEEEVDIERVKIIKVTPGSEQVTYQGSTTADEISDSQSSIITTERPITSENYGNGLVAVPITSYDETGNDGVVEMQSTTYISPDSGIEIISASVSIFEDDEVDNALQDVSVEGTIFSISTNSKTFSLVQDSSVIDNIKVKDSTLIKINDKSILFNELKVGDIVRVDGLSKANSNEVDATLIDLVGSYQIIQ